MATKVQVKNFQSIKKASLEIDGFTVITGKNNSGKTALQRAIRGVFENSRGHSFVRHGESHCEISLSFDDGDKVTWFKGKKENKYVINGKTYDKVGAGTPDELKELGVYPIQCGGKTISPQFAPQFTGQVFLLNETGSVLAEAVSDIERVSTLNKALKESERDRRSKSSELKVRKKDKRALEESLSLYDGLDSLGETLATLENREKEIKEIERALSEIKELKSRYQEALNTVSHLEGISSLSVPHKESLIAFQSTLEETENLCAKYKRLEKGHTLIESILNGVSGVVSVLDNNTLVEGIRRCGSGVSLLKTHKKNIGDKQSTVSSLEKQIQATEKELAGVNQELHETLKEHTECPLCGGVC